MRRSILGLCFGLFAAGAAAQSGQPIRIASSLDLSGGAAALGQEVLIGVQLAVDTLNKRGGVLGRPVEFVYRDNGTNTQRAVNQATELAREGAAMLISPIASGSVIATTRTVSEKFKIPMCVPTAGSDQITIKEFQPYIFVMTPSLYMSMRALTTRLAKEPFKRYAIIIPDNAGGRDAVRWFKGFLKEMKPDTEIVVEEYPKLGATDYTATINKVVAAKPDYVWSLVYGSDYLTFSKQASALGFFKQVDNHFVTVVDTLTLTQFGEDAPIGTDGYQFAPFAYLLSDKANTPKATQDWFREFKASRGLWPSDWAVMAHDCVMAWAQAATNAKTINADDIVREIETSEFDSLRGRFRFSKYDHQGLFPVFAGKVTYSKEYSQAVLDIRELISPDAIHPSEAVVESYRKPN